MEAELLAPPLSEVQARAVSEAGLDSIRQKLDAGERLDLADGVALFACRDLGALGALANRERERRWGDLTFFNRNTHVNATNVCEASCIFCSFARLKTGDPDSYTMSIDEAVGRVRALRDELITEVHIVNGLNPDLPWSYYLDLLSAIRAERPDLHIKAFTAVEIHYFAEKYGMTYERVLRELIAAGLGSLPGGGAEIFHERARKKLCDDKVDADGWLEVHRTAHRLGLRTNCTMLFGSIETVEERVDHMLRLRGLQDETGGFQTFIPLRFHHENNRLRKLREPTAADSLRTYAVSRLMLGNIDHIKAYWVMLGMPLAQLTLGFGVDDIDGTVREERIYHMAGARTPQELTRAELVRLIRDAGRIPVERDTLYNIVAEA
jgi:aminodeoxyfutalosine synthase